MDCFYKFITNPDWWSVIATFLAAIVAAWITYKFAKRQNELQEQQIKLQEQQILQQEYEIYSKLYKLVKRANAEIDYFFDEIIGTLGVVACMKAEDGFLKLKLDYIEQLCKDLEQNAIDFEIKFTKDFFDLDRYRSILKLMVNNLRFLVKMVDDKMMIYDRTGSYAIFEIDGCMEKGKAYYIAQHIKDKRHEAIIGSNLLYFIEERKKLRENSNDILAKIRERCKVE